MSFDFLDQFVLFSCEWSDVPNFRYPITRLLKDYRLRVVFTSPRIEAFYVILIDFYGRREEVTGGLGPLDFLIWQFPDIFSKYVCFLSFEREKWNFTLFSPPTKIFIATSGKIRYFPRRKSFRHPCSSPQMRKSASRVSSLSTCRQVMGRLQISPTGPSAYSPSAVLGHPRDDRWTMVWIYFEIFMVERNCPVASFTQ